MRGEMRCTCGASETKILRLFGEPECWRPLVVSRHRLEISIDMHLQEIDLDGVDSINLAQDGDSWQAAVNKVMNCTVPSI
jgi:hypothetical protein